MSWLSRETVALEIFYTDNQPYTSILRIQLAAEILGMQLTKTDMEADIIIVQAPVATQTEAEAKAARQQRRADQSLNTAVCQVM
ncbi:unnamed protein product [Anisakis simplex]|uniref:DWNN domain-containing protein n=1 Tax=Anisakis simplex TaxID=6269 RepID=A0A0M3KJA3_ANISI|nr:unnamed protein product [Anisakis simplex]